MTDPGDNPRPESGKAPTLGDFASGDNLTGHVVSAAVLGDGFSSIAVWILQLCHLDPPAAVDSGLTAICMIAASVIMKKLSP